MDSCRYSLDLQLKSHPKRQVLHSFYNILSIFLPCSRHKIMLTKENNKNLIHLIMEYLTTCGLVSHSTTGYFLYTYRNSSHPALQWCLLTAGYFSYDIMINIFPSTVCQGTLMGTLLQQQSHCNIHYTYSMKLSFLCLDSESLLQWLTVGHLEFVHEETLQGLQELKIYRPQKTTQIEKVLLNQCPLCSHPKGKQPVQQTMVTDSN